jgi:hypothetical protein
MSIRKSEVHELRDLTGVVAKGPTNKEPLVFTAVRCLVNMMYDCNISQHFFSYFRNQAC